MLVVRWIATSVLAGFALLVLIGNIIGIVKATREHGYSAVSLMSGLAATFAMIAVPVPGVHRWCWLGLLEPFCVPTVVYALAYALVHRR